MQVRRSALGNYYLGNYYLGNYYLLANGLVFFVFSVFLPAREIRAYLAPGLCSSLATRRRASLMRILVFSSLPRRSRRPRGPGEESGAAARRAADELSISGSC